jgi:hypothetical protein
MNKHAEEEAHWQKQHEEQDYAREDLSYKHYAPAYRTGYEGVTKYPGMGFDEVEHLLALDYEKYRLGSPLAWEDAQAPMRAAWDRLAGVMAPRDVSRGIRSGI